MDGIYLVLLIVGMAVTGLALALILGTLLDIACIFITPLVERVDRWVNR